jgi:electron transfer flavoprotein beta subunit
LKIIVCIKQTFDTEAKIVLTADGVDRTGVNLIMNPNDEFAVEEALRLKEKFGGEVTIVSLGGARAQDAIRQALAMGADKAILITDAAFDGGDEAVVAAALAKVMGDLTYDLILSGWVAVDDGSAQVPGRLAEALRLPQINNITKIEVDGNKAVVNREVEGATEIVEVELPALITAQKGLNEPRYPSLKGIMQAKKKELKKLSEADIGGAAAAKIKVLEYSLPEQRKAGKKLEGEPAETAGQLVSLLRGEAKVI